MMLIDFKGDCNVTSKIFIEMVYIEDIHIIIIKLSQIF